MKNDRNEVKNTLKFKHFIIVVKLCQPDLNINWLMLFPFLGDKQDQMMFDDPHTSSCPTYLPAYLPAWLFTCSFIYLSVYLCAYLHCVCIRSPNFSARDGRDSSRKLKVKTSDNPWLGSLTTLVAVLFLLFLHLYRVLPPPIELYVHPCAGVVARTWPTHGRMPNITNARKAHPEIHSCWPNMV